MKFLEELLHSGNRYLYDKWEKTFQKPSAVQQKAPIKSPPKKPPAPPRARRQRLDLAHAIGVRILDGTYAPGSVLPNEAEWGKIFGVSRTAVREAIKTLAGKGLLTSRPKIGSTVEPRRHWNMLDRDILSWHLKVTPIEKYVSDLFVLRSMVEPEAARLAATHGNPRQIERIAEAYDRMERHRKGGRELIVADLDFHIAILEAAENHFLTSLGSLIHTSLEFSFKYTWAGAAGMKLERLHSHGAVLRAIRTGSARLAERRMTELLDESLLDLHNYITRQHHTAGTTPQRLAKMRTHVHPRS